MICTYLNWVRIHWFEQIHKLNDLLISSFYFSVEITDFHRYEVKIEFLLRLWLVLYSPQPVLGSYFSIKWNNGTLQEEYWQQLPNTKTDTDREKGGSPGFEKYPHALPAMCLLAKLQLFWVSNQYFQWKHKWVWLRGRGAKSVRYIRKLPIQANKSSVPQKTVQNPNIRATHPFETVKAYQNFQKKINKALGTDPVQDLINNQLHFKTTKKC